MTVVNLLLNEGEEQGFEELGIGGIIRFLSLSPVILRPARIG